MKQLRLALAWALIIPLGILGFSGCTTPPEPASADQTPPSRGPTPASSKGGGLIAIVPPTDPTVRTNAAEAAPVMLSGTGRVHSVNSGLQILVIDYTLGGAPPLQSVIHVYRGNLRVGTLRLTGPERNGFFAAEIQDGVPLVNDEVRIH